jgi:hypothetical protein
MKYFILQKDEKQCKKDKKTMQKGQGNDHPVASH